MSTAEEIAIRVKRLSVEQQEKILEFVESFEPPRRSLLDVVKEIEETIPPEVLEKLPIDGAENHDHYLYGAPKK
ncbi:MAG TPA: hypothetical protein VGJ02_07225 [Pyrinomonadaceae bacterium]|jgi:hypothetical protein